MAVCVGSVPVRPERVSQGEAGRASEGAKEGRRKYTWGSQHQGKFKSPKIYAGGILRLGD